MIPTPIIIGITVVCLIYLRNKSPDIYPAQGASLLLYFIAYVAMYMNAPTVIIYLLVAVGVVAGIVLGIKGKKNGWNEKLAEIELIAGIFIGAIGAILLLILICAFFHLS